MKKLLIAIITLLIFTGCDTSEDKIYNAFKCSKAATLLQDHIKAKTALQKVEPFSKDVHGSPAYISMQLNQKFQDEFELYKYNSSGQIEIISELYNSPECKNMYKTSKIRHENIAENGLTKSNGTKKSLIGKNINNKNASLEDIFKHFNKCDFQKISYDPFKEETTHPYFKLTNLKPYKVEQSLAFYSVDDSLFGIPISHIILPVTWAFVSVTFDSPIDEVRPTLSTLFGEGFEATNESDIGYKPVLAPSKDDPSKTVLYCDEPEHE